MSFRNPILAGSVLVRRAIESVNFVSGAAGWMIGNDGTAEFNGATFRGNVVIDQNNTLLMYSANPAAGDLTISMAPQAGADGFGNPFPAGLQVLNHGGSGASGIAIGYAGTQPLLYFLSAVPNLMNDPALIVNTSGTGAAEFGSLVISGGEDATQTDYVAISLDSSSADGSSHIAEINDTYIDPSGGAHPLLLRGPGGTTIYAGSLYAVKPGTGLTRANPAASEGWHAATMATNWGVNITNDQAPRYRLDGLGGGLARLDGVAFSTAAAGSSSTMFTLPVGYRPTERKRFVANTNATTSAGGAVVEVLPTGAVVCAATVTASGQQVILDGIAFPVD